MRSVSSTLAAALDSWVRRPIARVLVDWDRDGATSGTYEDVSAAVSSVTVERSVNSLLPAEALSVGGGAAGQASVTLSGLVSGVPVGELTDPAGGYLSDRVGVPLTVQAGAVTDVGDEYAPLFTGQVRSVQANGTHEVALAGLDGSELVRAPVTLPTRLHDPTKPLVRSGMYLSSAVATIVRASGFQPRVPDLPFARIQPPIFAGVGGLDVPIIGDLTPDTGTLDYAYLRAALSDNPLGGPIFDSYGRVTNTTNLLNVKSKVGWTHGSNLTLNDGASIVIVFDSIRFVPSGQFEPILYLTAGDPQISLAYALVLGVSSSSFLTARAYSGSLALRGETVNNLNALPSGADLWLGLHISFTSTVMTCRARWRNLATGAVTDSITNSAVTGSTTSPILNRVFYIGDPAAGMRVSFAGLHVAGSGYAGPYFDASQAWDGGLSTAANWARWGDSATGGNAVIDHGPDQLVAFPAVESAQPWGLLQDIAGAIGGVAMIDETGEFRFVLPDLDAVAVDTVTTEREILTDPAGTEAVDAVRSTVLVPANPPRIDAATVIVWEAGETFNVPAGGTLVVPISFEGGIIELDTSVAYLSVGTGVGDGSGYRAAQNSDGTGGDVSNLGFSLNVYPARAELVINNPNGFPVYLVENGLATTTRGQPMLHLVGRLARTSESTYLVRARDEGSVAAFGEQVLDVAESPWRQTSDTAQRMAATILARTSWPRRVIRDVEVIGDVRRQLLDRVTLLDPVAERAGDFTVIGLSTSLDSGGLRQQLTLLEAGNATTGMTGVLTLNDPAFGLLDRLNGLG